MMAWLKNSELKEMKDRIDELKLSLQKAQERIYELEAGLVPEPNWEHAPDDAEEWAMDKDGNAFWYSTKPEMNLRQFYTDKDGHYRVAVQFDRYIGNGWETSRRSRPKKVTD